MSTPTNYFILSPGRCGSILTSYIIQYSLNFLNNQKDYCQIQHVEGTYQPSVFNTPTTVYHCHDPFFRYTPQPNCDFIMILRKDMLEGCLSLYLANNVFGIYTIDSTVHSNNKSIFQLKLDLIKETGVTVNIPKFRQLIDFFELFYEFNLDNLKSCFSNIHTLYYEDFNKNYGYINNILGIPEVEIPKEKLTEKLPYDKWSLINNKDEVLNLYESRTKSNRRSHYGTSRT